LTTSGATEVSPGVKMMIDKIKKVMKGRGSFGFVGLQRRFRIMDDDGSKSLSEAEFKKAMKELELGLSGIGNNIIVSNSTLIITLTISIRFGSSTIVSIFRFRSQRIDRLRGVHPRS
jgi:hypothetical protein